MTQRQGSIEIHQMMEEMRSRICVGYIQKQEMRHYHLETVEMTKDGYQEKGQCMTDW